MKTIAVVGEVPLGFSSVNIGGGLTRVLPNTGGYFDTLISARWLEPAGKIQVDGNRAFLPEPTVGKPFEVRERGGFLTIIVIEILEVQEKSRQDMAPAKHIWVRGNLVEGSEDYLDVKGFLRHLEGDARRIGAPV